MYVAQVLWAWLLLEVFTPTALTQRHRQRQGYGKSQLDGESTENENVQNEAAPFGRVDYMQKYAGPFEGEDPYMSSLFGDHINQPVARPYQIVRAMMPSDRGFYRQRRDSPSRARRAHTFTTAGYYNSINGRHFKEGSEGSFTKNDHINNHNHLQPYGNLYPPRAGGYYQQNAAPYSQRLQLYMPNPSMLGALPYYDRYYKQPFKGLYHNMPPSEEQHMRNQAQPSEDASVELTDSKEDQDEDDRKYGGPNAQGFPNGNMPVEQPYYKWKYGKSSEVMLSHMPLTEEESMKSNEEPSVGDSEGDQASEEGGNENMRKGAQRYTEDIPNPNLLEEISLHSLNPMNLRSSEEVVEENQDPEEDENTNQEGISSSNMPEEVHHYEEDYGKTFQADHQNNKTTGDVTASLEGATSFEADQQKTKTMEGEASLESSMTSQADQQNTKATGDEAASLESVKTSQADQQKTKTMGGEASLKSATTSHVDQQNTKSMGDEADSVESATPSISDTSTAETTPPEVIQSRTTITEVKHIQNKTESTTTTKPSRLTVQTTSIDRTQKNTKNIEVTSTQSGTDFLDYGRGLEDRSNATVSVE